MDASSRWSRRTFLASASSPLWAGTPKPSRPDIGALRRAVINSPVDVALHRAQTYTRVFQANESRPWITRKGIALREHLRTIPLYLREHDRIAGAITESPGAMPLIVEIGIGENNIY
ncbi:MAG: hypothetical protein MUC42_06240, partial [Bryobacter sp.]|nr:hypothetical protein [Bryobacter sp.]